jgi:hypothetical protein
MRGRESASYPQGEETGQLRWPRAAQTVAGEGIGHFCSPGGGGFFLWLPRKTRNFVAYGQH